MARKSQPVEYGASVLPGLEEVAGQEIVDRLDGARIIETRRGWVILSYTGDASDLLDLRTTEDVFVLLFRTTKLPSQRSGAIPLLTRMARNSRYWDVALTRFQQTRRHSVKRVTFRVVAQMTGKHGYRRQEVRDAVLGGIQDRWNRWKPVADDAHMEVWTPVVGTWALVAIRLSDRKMRHRTYKDQHRPASLRPTLAAAMVYLSRPRPGDRFCDPMCGTGTILAERALAGPCRLLLGGDVDPGALQAARANLSRVSPEWSGRGGHLGGGYIVHHWDARALPIHTGSMDVVVSNLPFGEQMGSHADNPALYDRFFHQVARILVPGGCAVLLTSEKELMRRLITNYLTLRRERQVLVGVLGQAARIYVLRKTRAG
jgi:23S rRNA G2445 N2-methylase RlmL